MPTAEVNRAIAEALRRTSTSVSAVGSPAGELLEPLSRLAAGGKRLRARLLLESHRAHGGHSHQAALAFAAGIELFQTAALVHDDVLDGADTRRGTPTIHTAVASAHRESGWTGDASHFGTSAAILAGDLALMAAQRCVASAAASLGGDIGARAAELFSDMAQLCTAGQYLDMRIAAQPVSQIAHQAELIVTTMRSKTSSYTTEYPLAIGAAVAGASAEAIETMRQAGIPLGIAFQLRDDVLGLVGAPEVTGKPIGDDIREGKRTLLVAHAWEHGDDATRARIGKAFGIPQANADAIDEAVAAVVDTGALQAAEQRISDEVNQARGALERSASAGFITSAGLAGLQELIDSLAIRAA